MEHLWNRETDSYLYEKSMPSNILVCYLPLCKIYMNLTKSTHTGIAVKCRKMHSLPATKEITMPGIKGLWGHYVRDSCEPRTHTSLPKTRKSQQIDIKHRNDSGIDSRTNCYQCPHQNLNIIYTLKCSQFQAREYLKQRKKESENNYN